MKMLVIRRRMKLRFSRLRRVDTLRLALGAIVFLAAVGFHIFIAVHFVNEQPDDGKLYVQLAKNIIEHGVFSSDSAAPFSPTLIRMPGYPMFLAAVYWAFGISNEMAVRVIQAVFYSITCIFAALAASNWTVGKSRRFYTASLVFILAAYCPFMAIYSATLLSETLTMFFLSATLLAATYALKAQKTHCSLFWWAVAGLLGGAGVLLRPDAGLFAFGIGLTLVFSVFFGRGKFASRLPDRLLKGGLFTAGFILVLVPWTIRNEYLFGVFQPLAPAHAEMPGEFVPHGYFLWLRTWIDDSKYIGPMLWNLETKPIRIEDVPASAFSSEEEKLRIAALLDEYNNSDPEHPASPPAQRIATSGDEDSNQDTGESETAETPDGADADTPTETEWDLKIIPQVDTGFEQIARERIDREPWRFYFGLPAIRAASMWFDTHSDFYPFGGELLPLKDLDEETNQHLWLPLFAALTWAYTLLAFGGALVLWLSNDGRSRLLVFLMLAVSVPRIVFFAAIENPEPRYLVELFIPAAILGGIFLESCGGNAKQALSDWNCIMVKLGHDRVPANAANK